MSETPRINAENTWSRPQIDRDRPNRRAGGLYRTAEDGEAGIGGIPLTSAEDSVVAAVRMAYKVADEQIRRSSRLGQRLSEAGDRAVGPRSDRKAVDATEKLVFDTAMSALTWIEGLAAEEGSPAKRLLAAQHRILGSLLGVGAAKPSGEGTGQEPPKTGPSEPVKRKPVEEKRAGVAVRVVLKGEYRRPVQLLRFDAVDLAPFETSLVFYSVEEIEAESMDAEVTVDEAGRATLAIEVGRHSEPGRWRGAICDSDGVQLGMIELEL